MTTFTAVVVLAAALGLPATTYAAAVDCASTGGVNQFTFTQSSSATATAVDGDINPGETSTGMQQCNGFDLINGPSAWISLSSANAANGIVQIGIIDCHRSPPHPSDNTCDDYPDVRNLFWAIGGCNGHDPYPQRIGSASGSGVYHFRIANNALYQRWDLYESYGAYALALKKSIPWSDPAVNCWATGSKYATVNAERWDPGDGWGTSGNPIVYTNVDWQHGSSTWYNMGGGPCYTTVGDGHCVGTSTGYKFWDS
jgi:hypothetical protein